MNSSNPAWKFVERPKGAVPEATYYDDPTIEQETAHRLYMLMLITRFQDEQHERIKAVAACLIFVDGKIDFEASVEAILAAFPGAKRTKQKAAMRSKVGDKPIGSYINIGDDKDCVVIPFSAELSIILRTSEFNGIKQAAFEIAAINGRHLGHTAVKLKVIDGVIHFYPAGGWAQHFYCGPENPAEKNAAQAATHYQCV